MQMRNMVIHGMFLMSLATSAKIVARSDPRTLLERSSKMTWSATKGRKLQHEAKREMALVAHELELVNAQAHDPLAEAGHIRSLASRQFDEASSLKTIIGSSVCE